MERDEPELGKWWFAMLQGELLFVNHELLQTFWWNKLSYGFCDFGFFWTGRIDPAWVWDGKLTASIQLPHLPTPLPIWQRLDLGCWSYSLPVLGGWCTSPALSQLDHMVSHPCVCYLPKCYALGLVITWGCLKGPIPPVSQNSTNGVIRARDRRQPLGTHHYH